MKMNQKAKADCGGLKENTALLSLLNYIDKQAYARKNGNLKMYVLVIFGN